MIIDYALYYHSRGFVVFPFKPQTKGEGMISYKKYLVGEDNITEELLKDMIGDSRIGEMNIGLLIPPSGIEVVDFDNMDYWYDLKPDQYEKNNLVSISGSGKRHLFLKVKSNPVGERKIELKRKNDKKGIDYLGNGIVILPPSLHSSGNLYRWVDPSLPILEVNDGKQFLRMLKKELGISNGLIPMVTKVRQPHRFKNNGKKDLKIGRVRPCIENATKRTWLGHQQRFAVVGEYKAVGFSIDKIVDVFRNMSDFDPDITRKQIRSIWDKSAPYKCDTLRGLGLCIPNCPIKNGIKSKRGWRNKDG